MPHDHNYIPRTSFPAQTYTSPILIGRLCTIVDDVFFVDYVACEFSVNVFLHRLQVLSRVFRVQVEKYVAVIILSCTAYVGRAGSVVELAVEVIAR